MSHTMYVYTNLGTYETQPIQLPAAVRLEVKKNEMKFLILDIRLNISKN